MAKLNHEKLALHILTTSSIREAAEKSGYSESTIYRLRRKLEFQEILNNVKDEMFQDTIQKSQGYCLEMLEVLRTIARNPNATDSSRVSAARTVLELGLTTYENESIIERLKELERRLEDD